MRQARGFGWGAAACVVLAAAASEAQADGYPPFFGYSGYFGGPAVYYTPTPDIHQSTTPPRGLWGAGVRTYTPGGPFWRYKPTMRGFIYRRHRGPVRVKG